jgi:hypothetical protein
MYVYQEQVKQIIMHCGMSKRKKEQEPKAVRLTYQEYGIIRLQQLPNYMIARLQNISALASKTCEVRIMRFKESKPLVN